MRFRAWYADGSIYDGESAEDWKALPAEGVVYVVELRATGRGMFNGGDWYYIDNGALAYVSSVEWGVDQPKPEGCADCVKRGVGVTDEEFARIMAEAKAYRG